MSNTADLATDPDEAQRAHLRGLDDHELLVVVADNVISLRRIFESMMEGLANVPFLKGRF